MKLRVHFTREDLLRIRVADSPDPMWESVNGLHLLQSGQGELLFRSWRRSTLHRLQSHTRGRRALHILTTLAPVAEYFPDFLTPSVRDGFDASLDALLSTPRQRLRAEMGLLADSRALPGWAGAVAAGEPEILDVVGDALRTYHQAAIQPHWWAMRDRVRADVSMRGDALLYSGGEGLLSSLAPTMRWESPVLEMNYPTEQDLYLEGRGLLLVPSVFCWRMPVKLADPAMPPTLVYPVEPELGWLDSGQTPPGGGSALAPLLGPTRAHALEAVAERHGLTTTALAVRVAVSPATASKHAAVLREAGLIDSHQDGKRVLHTVTSVGLVLLENASRPGPRTSTRI